MSLISRRLRLPAAWRGACRVWLILAISGMLLGCSAAEIDPSAPAGGADLATVPAAAVNPAPEAMPTATPETAAPSGPPAGPTPAAALLPLSLRLLAPVEGAGVEVGAMRVLGVTSPGASVEINGRPAQVEADGTFQQDLLLQEGINSVLAVARAPWGAAATENVLVLFVPRSEGVPLSVLFPQGLEVSHPEITIIGATRQDAVVGVNGTPVEVNSLGIFSTQVALEEGANLIEVVAIDLGESVNFQTVVVFYIP